MITKALKGVQDVTRLARVLLSKPAEFVDSHREIERIQQIQDFADSHCN